MRDEEVLTLRQVAEIVAESLGAPLEIVSLPWELATPARPLVQLPLTTHRVFDISKLRRELGYRDAVPAREAFALTARWLDAHPPEPGGAEESILQDPFDYAPRTGSSRASRRPWPACPTRGFATEPGYTLSYSGPGGRPRSKPHFE